MASPHDAVEAAEQNYLAAWKFIAGAYEGGEVEETDAAMFVLLPDSAPFFNSAFVRPPTDPRSVIEQARSFYGRHNTEFTLRFRESPDASGACEALGFKLASHSPLMNVSVGQVGETALDGIARVTSDSWDDHVRAIAEGFGMPRQLATRVFRPSLVDSESYAAFNAYVNGDVASTAALIVTDGIAGIYNVATPEPYRRRGLGEATTRAAVVEGGRRGCALATLQSSEIGYPVYERMGFRTVVHWTNMTST